jgi:hypothetical protein
MQKFRIYLNGKSTEIPLVKETWDSIGVHFVDDDGLEHPLVYVDNFYNTTEFLETDGEFPDEQAEATVYLHRGNQDVANEDLIHFRLPKVERTLDGAF